MNTTHPLSGLIVAAGILLATAGCTSEPGVTAPQDTTKFMVENTEKFVLLDRTTLDAVRCTGLQERVLPDNRLEVVANVKNRENHRVVVQVNCVFKDGQGFSTGDETPFRTLSLAENSTETVRFTAANTLAKRYTIRVRQAR